MTDYVVGFRTDRESVVLIRKNKPAWQAGRLNGVGGKIEPSDGGSSQFAMAREFHEETGRFTYRSEWERFATIAGPWGSVACFRSFGPVEGVRSMEEEKIEVHRLSEPGLYDECIPNLSWLIPLALYTADRYNPPVFWTEQEFS
jgi:8-oxo-dGTP diphosphatase